jgi:23S rRNA pseudouridine1911/1915/1917 synthase
MKIPILHQDSHIVAINKPAGLVVHSDGKTKEPALSDWIAENFPQAADVGEPIILADGGVINRPGIVHRLDRDTSGVMLIALTQEGFNHLKRQFQDRDIEKIYHTFVYGIMKEDDGIIDRPITRSRKDFRLWSAQRGGRGEARDAVTHYKVLNRIESDNKDAEATFVEVSPKTGRTHQIRVHFKAINHPVIADPLYAPKREPILGFERLALHARQITFADMDNNEITIQAPYPDDFTFALSKLV